MKPSWKFIPVITMVLFLLLSSYGRITAEEIGGVQLEALIQPENCKVTLLIEGEGTVYDSGGVPIQGSFFAEKGKGVRIQIKPSQHYTLQNLFLQEEELTSRVGEDGFLDLPAISENITLKIIFKAELLPEGTQEPFNGQQPETWDQNLLPQMILLALMVLFAVLLWRKPEKHRKERRWNL